MAVIYRIENREGFGPYSPIAPRFYHSVAKHPEPHLEGLTVKPSMSFGFPDLKLLTDWFSADEIETLSIWEEPWLVSKYETSDERTESSQTQAVFEKAKSRLIGCFPLARLSGLSRSQITPELIEELEASFEPHADCTPVEQDEILERWMHPTSADYGDDSSFARFKERRAALVTEQLASLREGCYYYIDSRTHVFRGGKIYALDSLEDCLEEVSLERLAEAMSPVEHILANPNREKS